MLFPLKAESLTDDTAGFRTLWVIKNAMIAILY